MCVHTYAEPVDPDFDLLGLLVLLLSGNEKWLPVRKAHCKYSQLTLPCSQDKTLLHTAATFVMETLIPDSC